MVTNICQQLYISIMFPCLQSMKRTIILTNMTATATLLVWHRCISNYTYSTWRIINKEFLNAHYLVTAFFTHQWTAPNHQFQIPKPYSFCIILVLPL